MVNRKLKKCASLFLVMSMAVSMLAGCGSKNATEEASSTSDAVEATVDDSAEVKKITYFTPKVPSDDGLQYFRSWQRNIRQKDIILSLFLKQQTQMVMIKNYVLWRRLMNFLNCLMWMETRFARNWQMQVWL